MSTANIVESRQIKVNSVNSFNFLSLFLSILLIAFAGMLILDSVKSIGVAHNRSLLLDQAKGEVDDLRMKNLELTEERDRVMSSGYIEEESRNRLFYAKDGEVVVVLPESGEVLGEEDENVVSDNSQIAEEQISGWLKWWMLLRDGI